MTATTPLQTIDSRTDDQHVPVNRGWERIALWSGIPLCTAGLFLNHLGSEWRPGRFGELIVLSLASLGGAWAIRRMVGWHIATGVLLGWALAPMLFVGILPSAATVLVATAALALGGLIARHGPAALRTTCGLSVMAGALGWLLPLPVHYRMVYLVSCVALIIWRWRFLRDAARDAVKGWQEGVTAAPAAAAFAVLALGLASTGAWIPTMQPDDVVYHLRLPWQLLEQHQYPLRPDLHIWSMAPWAADILQAIPQVIAGDEARGSLNALWMVLTATGVFRIAMALGGTRRDAWFAIALYASVPLTASLAGSMQTETPTAALIAWLACVILDERGRHRLWTGAVLVGGMLAMKLSSAVLALLLLPWALWRNRLPRPGALAVAIAITLVIAGSSYLYAAIIASNPVLPLFNAWFRSPYFDPVDFGDMRWHAGFNAALPWNLTFNTGDYLEAYKGGGGFLLIALAGAWVVAFAHRRSAAMALSVTVLIAAMLLPMQYLRYAFPAIVLLAPLLSVTASRVEPHRAGWLLSLVCILNLAFQANSFWLLRTGVLKMSVRDLGRDAPTFETYLPERNLIRAIRTTAHGDVIALDPEHPYVAELGIRGRSTSYYDRSLRQAALIAESDASGNGWATLIRHEGITDVLLRPATQTATQRAGLARLHATRERVAGEAEWWHIPAEIAR